MKNANRALVVIDLQNDYFPEGKFPLWNTKTTLTNVQNAIKKAISNDIPVVLVQHVASGKAGAAPFFNAGTHGVALHPGILEVAHDAKIVIKKFADSFLETNLENILDEEKIEEILLCGMMTQNCVTHTALSKKAEKYKISILADCCTTVSEMIHNIALNGLAPRVTLTSSTDAL
ncbi:Nicotinamidase-related amidase [Desulfomicrobium apsheronum]|uniref:Nicotinamidase-related amidase n=1 Tax=Desulfomicrobium apsheronum TaxID=52560 RepID=A0A1I3Q0R9_9BACT|nr:cysteine hydrolase family protein [Desulfomicrobium apsheronum]MDY0225465.1 cysteine hydrolase family protein [Desulfomicrobium apsheronum]SFJ26746.1 Nicotinamidase-related amidase [Desulfomicrobium apsheronum]